MKRLIVFCVLALMLAACAPAAAPTQAPSSQELYAAPAAAATQAVSLATPAPAGKAGPASPLAAIPAEPRMIIKDAQMELLVADSRDALDQITWLAADQGGYIIESRTELQGEYVYASLRMAVPSERFEATFSRLRALGKKVINETASGQDVSAEYTDLSSRLVNLEATAARVREFLKNAQTVEESLKVNAQLSELEGQIEQVKGMMKFYEGRAAYSTFTIRLTPEIAPLPTPTPEVWRPGQTLQRSADQLVSEMQGLVDFTIWLVVAGGPWLVFAALLILAARRLIRKSRASAH